MDTVGIRELRQNPSAVIARVERGAVIEVTHRGRRVARITPIPEDEGTLARLVAEGSATPATLGLDDLPPPCPPTPGRPLPSEILAEMRDDEI